MWILIRKELLENLLTLRLGVALVFCVILAVMATLIGSLDYSNNLDSYASESASQSDRNSQATTYNRVDPSIRVAPMPLSVLSRGNVSTSGQGVYFGLDYVPIGLLPCVRQASSCLVRGKTESTPSAPAPPSMGGYETPHCPRTR